MPARHASYGELKATAEPSMRISPASGCSIPVRILTRADLPAPFSPTSAMTSPARRLNWTSSRALTPGKLLETPDNARISMVATGFATGSSEDLGIFADVRLVEGEGLRHHDDAVFADLDLAHTAGGDLVTRHAFDGALDQVVGDLGRRVAEVDRVPDGERLGGAGIDRRLHLRRQTQTGDVDLADKVLVGHGLGGGDDADGGRRDDTLEVGVGFEQAEGFAIALVRLVVAIGRGDQLHLGVFRVLQFLLHGGDPIVLVRHGGGGAEDGELALVAHGVGHHLDLLGADQLGFRRIDLNDAALGRYGAVERHHL